MSVETLAVVLHHSKAKGTAKLVLVGIANHDGDGGAWPTVATLSRYANVDVRSVQRALVKLQQLGELHVDPQAGGLASSADCDRPNLYRVRVRCPTWCDGTPQHRDQRRKAGPQLSSWHGPQAVDKGVTRASPPGVGVTPPGDAGVTPPGDVGVTRTTLGKPPPEHRAAATVTTWVDQQLALARQLGPCFTCSQAADVCLAIPERVSGHRYQARPADAQHAV